MRTRGRARAERVTLASLPDELVQSVLEPLGGRDLVAAVAVSILWRQLSRTVAAERLSAAGQPSSPCVLRSLCALEARNAALGPRPERSWRAEWAAMDQEHDVCQGDPPYPLSEYAAGKPASVEGRLRGGHFASEIRWQVGAGWRLDDAQAYTLVFNHGRDVLGSHLLASSKMFAASTHVVCDVLARAARLQREPAPEAYANLLGAWGLADTDVAWRALCARGASPGLRFVTNAAAGGELGDAKAFPNAKAIHVPLTYEDGSTSWEPVGGPVVKFVSRPADGAAGYRSLVQTSLDSFDLPPLATVTLEAVAPAGSWSANGKRVRQKLFVVSVAFG